MKTRKLLAVLLTFALLFGCMQGVVLQQTEPPP